MTLADFYLVCFVVGFFLSLLMLIVNEKEQKQVLLNAPLVVAVNKNYL